MGIRMSDARRVPGNPLAGVLRSTARTARAGGRSRVVAVSPGPAGAVLQCTADGSVEWAFPAAYQAPPVVTATVVGPWRPGVATLSWVTEGRVALQLWDEYGASAPSGTTVHVTAIPVGPGVAE